VLRIAVSPRAVPSVRLLFDGYNTDATDKGISSRRRSRQRSTFR